MAPPPPLGPFLAAVGERLTPIDGWGRHRPGARPAAVTALLYRRAGEWRLPVVARRADLSSHPGQVALPGGGLHPGEGAWQAAAREVEEEIGVPARDLVPLGAGNPIYASVSNNSVVPFVAWLPDADVPFVHDPGELDAVIEVRLDDLLREDAWLPGPEPWMGPVFPLGETRIWGLTALILADLLARMRSACEAVGPAC